MGFQARLTLVAAAGVAVAIAIAAVVVYVLMWWILNNQVNQSLEQRAQGTHTVEVNFRIPGTYRIGTAYVAVPPYDPGGAGGIIQDINVDGTVAPLDAQSVQVQLPVSEQDRAVAAGTAPAYFRDDRLNGKPYRIYTTQFIDGYAIEVGRPLSETNGILGVIKIVLFVIAVGGIALAGVLGWFIARAGLWPITRLRATVDHVTTTGDLTQRVHEGEDELGRLGAHFNRMLAALDQSLRTQRQLVADASHELRTPLASLRTNIEVLQRRPGVELVDRDLLRDVVAQVEQLTRLIGDLIDLARGEQAPEATEEVRLDWVVASALERAALGWPQVHFVDHLQDSTIVGQPSRVERAIANLLDNAGKWSPAGGVVEVAVTDHEVTVRDHGPGIAPSDLPHIFDRFWRAPGARALPGSGLGLSIVRQVADSHGAVVTAELPPDGGTLMRLRFPAPPEPAKRPALPRRRLPLPGRTAS